MLQALVDIEVVRLPLLRHAIHAWMQQHLMPIPAPEVTPEALAAADARCPGWFADLRCGDVPRRGTQAAAKINNALIEWGRDEAAGEELKRLREAAMEVGWVGGWAESAAALGPRASSLPLLRQPGSLCPVMPCKHGAGSLLSSKQAPALPLCST